MTPYEVLTYDPFIDTFVDVVSLYFLRLVNNWLIGWARVATANKGTLLRITIDSMLRIHL